MRPPDWTGLCRRALSEEIDAKNTPQEAGHVTRAKRGGNRLRSFNSLAAVKPKICNKNSFLKIFKKSN